MKMCELRNKSIVPDDLIDPILINLKLLGMMSNEYIDQRVTVLSELKSLARNPNYKLYNTSLNKVFRQLNFLDQNYKMSYFTANIVE